MRKMPLSIKEYIVSLLEDFSDRRAKANTEKLINRILTGKSIQLWTITENRKEYDNLLNLINGELANVLDVSKLNISLLTNSVQCLQGQYVVSVIHDVCNIRKKESEKLEHLGWVQDLDGRWVKGYQTYNSVMIDSRTGKLKLLGCVPYSNGDPDFVSQEELRQLESNKMVDKEREAVIKKALEKAENYNSKSICKQQIKKIHDEIRAINPDIVIVHIFDRGYDDVELYDYIDSLGDKYVIRFKANRNSNEKVEDEEGKEKFLKLADKTFENQAKKHYDKVMFDKKIHTNATGIFEWDTVVIGTKEYQVAKIRFYEKGGKKIFKDPMLLISNYILSGVEMTQHIYKLYLQRPKIESVFKFLKDVFGWETFQIHCYEAIKNLIALAFFIGGYFYEIEDELIKNETVQWICELGNGKGKVTRYYFMEGLRKLLTVAEVEIFRKENQITDEQVEYARRFFSFT